MVRLGRERILMGSEPKFGKTTAEAAIIKGLPGSKFIVCEFDDGFTKVMNEHGIPIVRIMADMQALPAGHVFKFPVPSEWMDFYEQVSAIERWCGVGILGSKDWVITEAMDICYDEIIGEYAERTAESSMGRMEKKGSKATVGLAASSWNNFIAKRNGGGPILEGSDYNAIYTELRKTLNYLCYQMPCNWIATVGTEQVTKGEYENRDETNFYASMGMTVKYQGYKKLPRMCDTLVQFGKSMTGYTYQIHGDRGQVGQPGKVAALMPHGNTADRNFFKDFLVANGFQVQGSLPQNGLSAPVPQAPVAAPR